ncbi:MAG: site-2 protease family protein [Rubripirellula sp.]
MLIDWLAAFPLAATDDANFITTLFTSIMLWGRVALGIGLVIFVHELGHFVAAKTFGVKCEKFYVGFDVPIRIGPIKFPRTLGKFQYGETEYGIGIIPLGGYVKMLGQDDDPRKLEEENKRIQVDGEDAAEEDVAPQLDPRSFPAKPVWQRMIIISAGVVVNVITGVLFAAIAYGYGVSYSPAIVGGAMPGGPAWQAGIEPGGKVVAVGTWKDDNMHYREMVMEILMEGMDEPEAPLDLSVQYGDEVQDFKIISQPRPAMKEARMVGLAMPHSTVLREQAGLSGTIAENVLSEDDAGARIVAFDGTPIDDSLLVAGTPLLHYMYSNPTKTIQLELKRSDDTTHKVDLPPQSTKFMGLRFAIGPITAMVGGGPAEKAGMKIGDVIKKLGDNESPDAYGLALALVGTTKPVSLTVERGNGDEAEEVALIITPSFSAQTLPPTSTINGEIAINSVGFAYQPLTKIASVVPEPAGDQTDPSGEQVALQAGDEIQEIRFVVQGEEKPEWLKNERFVQVFDELINGWEFSAITPLSTFRETLQMIPDGTELKVMATRPPEDRVISTTVVVRNDSEDRVMFERGLALGQMEATQQAESLSEALALGVKEGKRRFFDVLRFLKMLPQGRIKLKHVGGPLEIVNIAKKETEKGTAQQLMFLTMLSMNLAILNFLPIPALDGGHMMFLLYELVAGKRANEQLEFRLTVAGLLTLLMLMVVVFANDIMRHLP